MGQLDLDPPYDPKTTPSERAIIRAQISTALTNASVRLQQIQGSGDHTLFAVIAGDLFEELVDALNSQIKTTKQVGFFDEIVMWSVAQTKQFFPDHPFTVDDIDARALGRRKRFSDEIAARLSKNASRVERDIGALLDEEAHRLNISHEDLAERIGIPRSTYFDVKAGRAGKRSRWMVEAYFSKLQRGMSRTDPD